MRLPGAYGAMTTRDIVVIGVSTGGLQALRVLLGSFPTGMPATVLVVMHTGAHRSILPELLRKVSVLPVEHARHDQPFLPSAIYIAPPDRHLLLSSDCRMKLSAGPKENFTRPAADPLFRSAAVIYGERVVGVVMTGDLDDGAAGLAAIQACGGYAIVQDPADCVAPSMPTQALRAVSADAVAPLSALSEAILKALIPEDDFSPKIDGGLRRLAEIENRIELTGESSSSDMDAIGSRSEMTCPSCGGVIWRVGEQAPLRFRCHTGHAFSALSLAYEQSQRSEDALWAVVRGLEERISLVDTQLGFASANADPTAEFVEFLTQLNEAKQALVRLITTRTT